MNVRVRMAFSLVLESNAATPLWFPPALPQVRYSAGSWSSTSSRWIGNFRTRTPVAS